MAENDLLQTVSSGGVAPESRIKDPQSASDIVTNLFDSNAQRRKKWAEVDRMFGGTPPYDPQVLRNNGQAWRSNVPTMTGKSILSNSAVTYYDLFNASDTFFQIDLDLKDSNKSVDISRSVTSAVDKILKKWPDFYNRMWSMINDYVRHGRGFLCWKDDSWKFNHLKYNTVMVPDETEIDIESAYLIVVIQDVNPTWLWKRVMNKDVATKRGWNVSGVIDAIRNAIPADNQNSDDEVKVTQSLLDNDLWLDTLAKKVRIAHIYVKEYDGKWSYYIIEYENQGNSTEEKNFEFLYKKIKQYDKLEYFFTPFFFEVMSGSWNGASGLGKDIHPMIQNQDRLTNAIFDSVYLRTGINLQAQNASALRRLSTVQIGGALNIFPPGFDALNSSVLGDLNGALEVDRMLNITLERNTGIYRPNVQNERGNPKTATETQIQFARSTTLTNSAVDRWYTQEDRLGAELWRRIKMDPELIRELIKETGATKTELSSPAIVTTSRAIGNGSQAARQQAVTALSPMVGSFPEEGRQNWLDDVIAVQANQSKVQRYNPRPPERDAPTQQQWEAMEENGTLASGAPVIRYPTQNDLIHAQTHLQFMSASAEALKNQANPEQVLQVLNNVGPHTQVHLDAMSQDSIRKQVVDVLSDQLENLSKVADKLSKLVIDQAKQAAENQPQEQMDPKLKADIDERVAKLQLDAASQDAKIQLDKQKNDAEIQNMNARTQADIEARKAQSEAQIKQDIATPDN